MSFAHLIQELAATGAPIDAIVIAVRVVEGLCGRGGLLTLGYFELSRNLICASPMVPSRCRFTQRRARRISVVPLVGKLLIG